MVSIDWIANFMVLSKENIVMNKSKRRYSTSPGLYCKFDNEDKRQYKKEIKNNDKNNTNISVVNTDKRK